MLHMLRAGSGNLAEQCGRRMCLARYLLIMKILTKSFCFTCLAVLAAHAFAQPPSAPARANATAGTKPHSPAVDHQKATGQKDPRVKRGTDLRLALMPQNSNANASSKTQGGLANASDLSIAEPQPEHHLNLKERQEMRELLRQQRLKQQQN